MWITNFLTELPLPVVRVTIEAGLLKRVNEASSVAGMMTYDIFALEFDFRYRVILFEVSAGVVDVLALATGVSCCPVIVRVCINFVSCGHCREYENLT